MTLDEINTERILMILRSLQGVQLYNNAKIIKTWSGDVIISFGKNQNTPRKWINQCTTVWNASGARPQRQLRPNPLRIDPFTECFFFLRKDEKRKASQTVLLHPPGSHSAQNRFR